MSEFYSDDHYKFVLGNLLETIIRAADRRISVYGARVEFFKEILQEYEVLNLQEYAGLSSAFAEAYEDMDVKVFDR